MTQEDKIAKLAKVFADLDAQKKEIEAKHKKVATALKEALGKGTKVFGDVVITVNESRRVDWKTLEADHPYKEAPGFYTLLFDKDAVDEQTKNEYTNKVKSISVKKAER